VLRRSDCSFSNSETLTACATCRYHFAHDMTQFDSFVLRLILHVHFEISQCHEIQRHVYYYRSWDFPGPMTNNFRIFIVAACLQPPPHLRARNRRSDPHTLQAGPLHRPVRRRGYITRSNKLFVFEGRPEATLVYCGKYSSRHEAARCACCVASVHLSRYPFLSSMCATKVDV